MTIRRKAGIWLVMVLATGFLAACMTRPVTTKTTPRVVVSPAPTSVGLTAMDLEMITQAMQDLAAEVQIAQLARDRGVSDRVRELAEMLIRDHTQALNELAAMARGRVAWPVALTPRHTAVLHELAALNGQRFDVAFLEHMIADHAKAIAFHERMAASAVDPGLRAWAARQLPALRSHYATVNDLHIAMGRLPGDIVPSASPRLRMR